MAYCETCIYSVYEKVLKATSFAQRNCDVIQNGAEKMNGRPIERKNTGQLSLACTGNLRDNRQPRRLGSVLPSSNAIKKETKTLKLT